MNKFKAIGVLLLVIAICCGCHNEPVMHNTTLEVVPVGMVDYVFLLDSQLDLRKITVPIIFKNTYIQNEITCSVESFTGEKTEDLSVKAKHITFSSDANREYLLGYVDVEIQYNGKTAFEPKQIQKITFNINEQIFDVDVSIYIQDRSTYGEYRNINENLMTTPNVGTKFVIDADYKDRICIVANALARIESVEYVKNIGAFNPSATKTHSEHAEKIELVNQTGLNVDMTNGDILSVEWDVEKPQNVSFWGSEKIIKYRIGDVVYIDSYFTYFCYEEILIDMLKER